MRSAEEKVEGGKRKVVKGEVKEEREEEQQKQKRKEGHEKKEGRGKGGRERKREGERDKREIREHRRGDELGMADGIRWYADPFFAMIGVSHYAYHNNAVVDNLLASPSEVQSLKYKV